MSVTLNDAYDLDLLMEATFELSYRGSSPNFNPIREARIRNLNQDLCKIRENLNMFKPKALYSPAKSYLQGLLHEEKINLDEPSSRYVLKHKLREFIVQGDTFAHHILNQIIVHDDKPYLADLLLKLIEDGLPVTSIEHPNWDKEPE